MRLVVRPKAGIGGGGYKLVGGRDIMQCEFSKWGGMLTEWARKCFFFFSDYNIPVTYCKLEVEI